MNKEFRFRFLHSIDEHLWGCPRHPLIASFVLCGLFAGSSLGETPNPSPTPVPVRVISCAADLTFGDGGKVTTDFPGGSDRADAVAVQADGKIVVAGTAHADFALVRLNPDGSLDTTFGAGGRVYTDFFLTFDQAHAIVIQPDGKIVVAGSATVDTDTDSVFESDFALARYNTDGSLDTSFGIGGRVTTDFAGQSDEAFGVALQADGRIVVAGGTGGGDIFSGFADMGLARYNRDGTLDATFGAGGRVTTDFGLNTEQARGVAIQSDGKIVAAGGGGYFALARYNPDGTLDTSFDTDGKVTTDFADGGAGARGVAIQSDGKIVAAGSAGVNFALARYNTHGGLDQTFDGDGRSTIVISESFGGGANAVVIQPDGKIVAAGNRQSGSGSGHDFIVIRLNTDGTPDTTFDGDGMVITNFFFTFDKAAAVALQADGRIVAAGETLTGSTASIFQTGDFGPATSVDFAVARYNTNGSLDTTFDGDGKLTPELFYMEERVVGLGLQSDGRIVAAGSGEFFNIQGSLNPDFQLARYTTNGRLDTTFGTAGRVSTDLTNGSRDFARAIAILPDDRILVAGYTSPDNFSVFLGGRDFALARYNPDGSPDTTFDGDGLLTADFNNTRDEIAAMRIQPDGKIVVAGLADNKPALVRYHANGGLDPAFGSGGRVLISSAIDVNEIELQSDGKIIAGGFTPADPSQPTDLALARYNSDGSPDDGSANHSTPGDSFGSNGLVVTSLSDSGFELVSGIVVQPDGRIVIAAGDLLRYNPDGSLDTTFDGDGKVTASVGALALQADGKIVGAGSINTASDPELYRGDFAVARFHSDGRLDTSICTGGAVFTDFFGEDDRAVSLILQPDGKSVLGGWTYTGGTHDFALARYDLGTPTLLNISTRMHVGTDPNQLIGGFIIDGTEPKKVIILATGPSLAAFGLQGVLEDPVLQLFKGNTLIASNDNWTENRAEIEATQLQPSHDLESAFVQTLAPGAYTAVVRGTDGTGVGTVQMYDLAPTSKSKLANISSRGFVQPGDDKVMIAGFIIGNGGANSRVVVRALGPSLSAFGIAQVIPDPTLELKDANGSTLLSNDDWQQAAEAAEISSRGLAPGATEESALAISLPQGGYTAIVRGKGDVSGVAVVEVYNVE